MPVWSAVVTLEESTVSCVSVDTTEMLAMAVKVLMFLFFRYSDIVYTLYGLAGKWIAKKKTILMHSTCCVKSVFANNLRNVRFTSTYNSILPKCSVLCSKC